VPVTVDREEGGELARDESAEAVGGGTDMAVAGGKVAVVAVVAVDGEG